MNNSIDVPSRADVPQEQTWDVNSIFPDHDAWSAACDDVEARIPALKAYSGTLGKGPERLLEFLDQSQDLLRRAAQTRIYAGGFHMVDTTDATAAAMFDRGRGLLNAARAAMAFLDPELMEIGFDKLRDWIRLDERLAYMDHYVDALQRRLDHIQSAQVENVLASAVDVFQTASSTYRMLVNADITFDAARDADGNETPVTQGTINSILASADRQLRKSGWENYADGHLKFKNTLANSLATVIKQDVFNMRARGYSSSLEASLAPNHIPVEVFHNLIEAFQKHAPTWHRYWRVRKRMLGVDKLHVYDIWAPLSDHRPEVPFEQAVEWISAGMKPLGDEYIEIMRRGVLQERWVDHSVNIGKRAGAFSTGSPGTHPFIMMSYANTIFNMSTLAHELGHSMHSYYTWQSQPIIYSRYSLFLAEVASNFNQALVRGHLYETQSDPALQLALIEENMSNFHRYLFIMPTLARFELETHERIERGQALNARDLIDLMTDLFAEGYGGEVEIDHDRIGITWSQFSHLYMNFYVYQYATGIAGAYALVDQVRSGQAGAAKRYLDFLKTGSSMFPLDALKKAGVDLSEPEPVEKAFEVLGETIDRLEKLAA